MKINGMDAFIPKKNMKPSQSNVEADKEVYTRANSPEKDRVSSEISVAFLNKAIEKANRTMAIEQRQLEFRIHEKTNEIMVRVVDAETKEVLREIPPEKLLDMFASMLEMAGLLIDERR